MLLHKRLLICLSLFIAGCGGSDTTEKSISGVDNEDLCLSNSTYSASQIKNNEVEYMILDGGCIGVNAGGGNSLIKKKVPISLSIDSDIFELSDNAVFSQSTGNSDGYADYSYLVMNKTSESYCNVKLSLSSGEFDYVDGALAYNSKSTVLDTNSSCIEAHGSAYVLGIEQVGDIDNISKYEIETVEYSALADSYVIIGNITPIAYSWKKGYIDLTFQNNTGYLIQYENSYNGLKLAYFDNEGDIISWESLSIFGSYGTARSNTVPESGEFVIRHYMDAVTQKISSNKFIVSQYIDVVAP